MNTGYQDSSIGMIAIHDAAQGVESELAQTLVELNCSNAATLPA